jgi:LacI family transcriptional regulator
MASRILGGRRQRHDEVTSAVLHASQQLGYEPNLVARSLREQATNSIAMVVPGVANPFFPQLIEAIARRCAGSGKVLLLADSCGDSDLEAAQVRALLERRVDGMIIVPVGDASVGAVRRAAASTPTVQLDRPIESSTHTVKVDSIRGMRSAVGHLVDSGRSRLALISGDTSTSTGKQRLQGFRSAMDDHQLGEIERVSLGAFDVAHGLAAGRRLLTGGDTPDAIVCGADVIALGVLQAARELRLRVPQDLAITGFDDIEFAALASPSLTTVRQPAEAMARIALDLLGRDDHPLSDVVLAPELIVRDSSIVRS